MACPTQDTPRSRTLRIPWSKLSTAARSADYASDLTHPLYRYPARMCPELARTIALELTRPGDTILDPFCGGGTTAVEALAHGRTAICADLSRLACFVTRAKASPPRQRSLRQFERWAERVPVLVSGPGAFKPVPLLSEGGGKYAATTHGLLLALRNSARRIEDGGARRLAMLTVLRVGQLCFDCRTMPPSPSILIRTFKLAAWQSLKKMRVYAELCARYPRPHSGGRRLRVLQCDAAHVPIRLRRISGSVALVLTSPPYPGVHTLYHRWQLYGRRETALPWRLLAMTDGRSEAHYTLGSRFQRDNNTYFERLHDVFGALRPLLKPNTLIVQVVAFSQPRSQLSRFRDTMIDAGFVELRSQGSPHCLITRVVPHRKWYAGTGDLSGSALEYLFIHKPRWRPSTSTSLRLKPRTSE